MLKVRFYDGDGWLAFEAPRHVLRASSEDAALRCLDEAERAVGDGLWIAGYLSYELGAALEGASLRTASMPLLSLGIYDAPSHEAPAQGSAAWSPLLPLIERADYDRAVLEIARRIRDGDVYQVNYSVPFAFDVAGSVEAAWSTIAARTGARYQAFVEDGVRFILSWSPELFLQFDGTIVETRPMKGTAPLDRRDALHDAKNRAEHVMIVDLLRNDLHRVSDDVSLSDFEKVETYSTFLTMTSRLSAVLPEGTTLASIVRALFPCGSITGAPKRAAVAAIAALESHARDAYCGTIGFLSPQRRGWWNVAIRSAQLQGTSGVFHAGGGIVADSKASDEWNEVLLKTAFLAQPFELWETLRGDASADVIDEHLQRLSTSAERLSVPFDVEHLRTTLANLAHSRLVRIRLRNDGSVEFVQEPLPPLLEVDVVLSDCAVQSNDPWLRVKSSWRPVHRAAYACAQEHDCFDALLVNERGELTEGTRTNLFVELEGKLWTPPGTCGLLPGILRAHLIREGRVRERVIRPEDLERSTALFIGNSARGLLRVRTLVRT